MRNARFGEQGSSLWGWLGFLSIKPTTGSGEQGSSLWGWLGQL